MKIIKPAISFVEYEKIFRILHAVEGYLGRGSRPDCQFYNIVGSYILSEVYKISAFPVAGAALLKVSNDNSHILAFADTDKEFIQSDSKHFHCWIETPTHFLDFISPLYDEYSEGPKTARNLMFQKTIHSMSESIEAFSKAGDFIFLRNIELTKAQIPKYTKSQIFQDALYLARSWAQGSKNKLMQSTWLMTEDGEKVKLPISRIELTGSW